MKKITYLGVALMAALSAQAQYQHGFEGSTELPAGFTVLNENGGYTWAVRNTTLAFEGSNVASIRWDSGMHDDYLIFPEITVVAGVTDRLSFQVRSDNATYIESYEVLLSTTGRVVSDFTTVLTPLTETPPAWNKKEYNLTAYEGQTIHIAIRARSTNEFYLSVDDVKNDALPPCPVSISPDNTSIANITSNSAVVTLPALDEAIAYHIALQTPEGVQEIVLDTHIWNIEDLASLTTYTFTVQAECEEGMGDTSVPFSFTTLCGLVIDQLGVIQGNEGTTGAQLDPCWATYATEGTTVWSGASAGGGELDGTPPEGTRSFSKPYTNSEALLLSPRYNIAAMGQDAYKVQLYFFHRQTQGGDNDMYTVYANTTNSIDGATQVYQVPFKQPNQANGWYVHEFALPAEFATEETVHFIIKANTSAGLNSYGMGMDAFKILPDNGCDKPTAIQIANITENAATLSWTSDATEFAYYLSTSATTPGLDVEGEAVSAATITLEQLNHSTQYYFWVRAICDEGVESDWSTLYSFRTACGVIAEIDVVLGNEGTTGALLDPCWMATQVTGTTNWVGANTGANELNVNTTEGTRVFSKTWTNSSADLISPAYNLAAIGLAAYEVSMNLYRRGTQGHASDVYHIMINTAPNSTGAQTLGTVQAREEGLTAGWYTFTYQIPAEFATAEAVYFIINGTTNGGSGSYGLGMDAFVVTEGESLGLNDNDALKLKVYPNPTNDRLYIQSMLQIDEVQIYNALGQAVFTDKVNASDAQLNLSQLPTGTYFVKITAEGNTRTVKVIKN